VQIWELLNAKGTDVYSASPDTAVIHIVGELTRRNIGAAVISRDGIAIDGIASERDIVRALNQRGAAVLNEPIREVMSTPVLTCAPEDDIESVMATMTNNRVRHVPVVANDTLAGIVSIGDVVKIRLGELEHEREILNQYIGGR
jgi:CBS domain-containing protein